MKASKKHSDRIVRLSPGDYWQFCALDARSARVAQTLMLARMQMAMSPSAEMETTIARVQMQLQAAQHQLQVHFEKLVKRYRLQPKLFYAPGDSECALHVVRRAKG